MPSKINFMLKTELYKSDKKIKFNKSHTNEIIDSIKSYSRVNSENNIISYKLGIINLNKTNIQIYDDYLCFEFDIDININSIDDAEEVIWCIFEPAYSIDGLADFTIESTMKRHYYTLKCMDTPKDIQIKKFEYLNN